VRPGPSTPLIPTTDLDTIVGAFGLGDVREAVYLATGLVNRNWRLTTDTGRYALKQIIDVWLPTARRNLHALAGLSAHGIPPARPCRAWAVIRCSRSTAGATVCCPGATASTCRPFRDGSRGAAGCEGFDAGGFAA
jgi:hypothetical protein